MNPFLQGWSNTSGSPTPWVASPSVFGVLPYPTPAPTLAPATPKLDTYTFSSSSGTVLNSVVTGPHSQRYFRVTTDSTTAGFSVVQNVRNESIAMIEWRKHPVVEIIGIVSKRNSAQWLTLSPDKASRLMNVRGRNFLWMPDDRCISLYSASSSNPQFFGRVSQNQNGTTIEMTAEALQVGLLETFVVSTLLLMSGRNID
ncbi:hypothetical protein DFH07DRAFT_542591 [Mycena maculata]|uniref:DUF6593 domain-containing protein n=1 Tax=Mycena maculata TaxID=230809 RepID=A0AAD7IWV1_9AGAR|nr:hypothetical protein DFH07DRAFT_542591 [Mycena maculata]